MFLVGSADNELHPGEDLHPHLLKLHLAVVEDLRRVNLISAFEFRLGAAPQCNVITLDGRVHGLGLGAFFKQLGVPLLSGTKF